MLTVPAAAAAALEHLIDYAGLFPPARLELADAVDRYDEAACGAHGWMLGRFVVPLERAGAVANAVPLSAIVTASDDAFAELNRLRERGARIEALEVSPADPRTCAEM